MFHIDPNGVFWGITLGFPSICISGERTRIEVYSNDLDTVKRELDHWDKILIHRLINFFRNDS